MALPFNANFSGGAAALADPPYQEYPGFAGRPINKDGSGHAVAGNATLDTLAIDDSNTYTTAQHSKVTINLVSTSSDYVYLVINATGNQTSGNNYWLWWNGDGSDIALLRGSAVAWGGQTTEKTTTNSALSPGDTLDLINDGAGNISVQRNGSTITALNFTDGSSLTGGAPGFGMSDSTAGLNVKFSAWLADDVSTGTDPMLTGQACL